jgi:ABC-2 type transport system permease protein
MKGVLLIVSREMGAYLRTMNGYVIAAPILLLQGLLFHAFALGGGERLSSEVLRNFFYFSSGTTMIAAVLLSMRLFAEERRDGTLVLLTTAPLSDWQIVLGKWLSAFFFLSLILIASLYMPIMVMVNGSLHPGHVMAGYVGLLLLGAACTALSTLASSLAPSQVLAAVLGGALVVGLILMWKIADAVDGPFDRVFAQMDLFYKHFRPFMDGTIHTRDVAYYLSVTFFALLMTRQVLGARRWR